MKKKANEERERRRDAREATRWLQLALASGHAADFCWLMFGSYLDPGDPAEFLHMVAHELKGKLKDYRAGDYDEAIKTAWKKAPCPDGWDGVIDPPFEDIMQAFERKWEKSGMPKHMMPTSFSIHRSLQRLGYTGPPPKRGPPPGPRPNRGIRNQK
jgi:hypothetical protein